MINDTITYRIDRTDTILSVSDNWYTFADANDYGDSMRPEDIIGHKLWDFIQGRETRFLYEELFRRVRNGTHSRIIPFRCDSPSERRYLELVT